MQSVSKQRISKYAFITRELLLETVFSLRSVQSGYKEENWGSQFSWGLAVQLRPAREAERRWRSSSVDSWKSGCEDKSCKSVAVTRRFCVGCSYSDTVVCKEPQLSCVATQRVSRMFFYLVLEVINGCIVCTPSKWATCRGNVARKSRSIETAQLMILDCSRHMLTCTASSSLNVWVHISMGWHFLL
jgi:hypothetical protein